MKKVLNAGFWGLVARIILRNRVFFLGGIILITVFFGFQWKNIKFTQTEANLIPYDDQINIDYRTFLQNFGEEGNLVVIATKDPKLFTPKVYGQWTRLMNTLSSKKEVELVISINNLKKLVKNDALEKFELTPLINPKKSTNKDYLLKIKSELLQNMPFYEGCFSIKNQEQYARQFILIKRL